ncbi:MAG: hypothetical protein ABH837_00665 [bacterium]
MGTEIESILLKADISCPFEKIVQVVDEGSTVREFTFTTADLIPICSGWQSGTSNTASGRHITVSVVPAADTPQIYLDEGLMYAKVTINKTSMKPLSAVYQEHLQEKYGHYRDSWMNYERIHPAPSVESTPPT